MQAARLRDRSRPRVRECGHAVSQGSDLLARESNSPRDSRRRADEARTLRGCRHDCAPLTFGGEREAGENVVVGKLGKIREEFCFRRAAGEKPQNLAYRNTGAAYAGFSRTPFRVDPNALEEIHGIDDTLFT